MRAFYVAVASIAIVASAGGIRASVVDTGPSDISPMPKIDARAASVNGLPGQLKPRDDAIRLAQVGASNAPETLTTGNPGVAPFKWAGYLNMPGPTKQNPNGGIGCTAQFITPNVLLTAGHCLRDLPENPTGPWGDPAKGNFILQYQNHGGTVFEVQCAAPNPLWAVPANFSSLTQEQQISALNTATAHDFGMVLIKGTSPIGYMPYALDWKGKYGRVHRIGYPENILGGQVIQSVGGIVFFADTIPLPQGSNLPNTVVQWGPITDATQGMSGGGWVVNATAKEDTGNNILIAVTSNAPVTRYNAPEFPGGSWAAYLTSAEFNPLLDHVKNGCK